MIRQQIINSPPKYVLQSVRIITKTEQVISYKAQAHSSKHQQYLLNMTDKYYIGWVRSGKDGKGLVKYRPRKLIANAVTTMVGGIADPRDGLGNTTPHIVYEYE